MTKRFTILALVAAALTFSGCQSKREKENTTDRSQEVIDSLQRVLAQSNSESEDLAKTIQQIREGFRQINEAEGRVTQENAETPNQQVIVENMAFIQQTLRLNRARIADLQQQLRNASQTSKETKSAYEAMVEEFNRQLESKSREIEELRKQLAEKDIKIAEQSEQIDQLSDNVEDLTTKNEEKERTVVRQDQQLHTAWYVFGTKKELREQHILERGDVMRSSNFNKEYFTKIDIRVTQKIPLYSKKATLLTSHPAGSYTLDKDAQENYTLRITNPDAFWSVSRYLVILVR
jgi:chromosome segregation ATPase